MKFLFDLFPVILFFIAFKLYGFYIATAVAIAASLIQVGLFWIKFRKFENMHLITLAMVLVFGGATLLFEDEMFFKWKPSVINWLFAAVFIGSHFIGQKTIIERMMGKSLKLPAPIWTKLNISWSIFFILLGIANIIVVYQFDTDTWVNFKVFGLMGLTILFIIAQALYMSRYLQPSRIEE